MPDLNTMTFGTKDGNATVTKKISFQTLQDLVIIGNAQRNFQFGRP
jgi:hypothetical protein